MEVTARNNVPPPEYPRTLQEYDDAYSKLTWYELRYLEEFNELSNSRTISLGGMGGALLGHITYQEIYAFLSLGMSAIQDPVNTYVKVIKGIDNEYVAMKQKKLDDEAAKASKSSSSKDGKKFIGAPATSKSKPLPHNID
jgi:hypothetical protein